jgi:hypothetical protein
MSEKIDLPDIQRGDTIPYTFNWDDGVDPVDMQGKTLIMSFKLDTVIPDADSTLLKTVVYDAVDAQAALGVTSFRLEASETALLLPNTTYQYAIRIIQTDAPEDIETTFFNGSIFVGDA